LVAVVSTLPAAVAAAPPIVVRNATELQAAVGNPANAGRRIVLERGKYELTPSSTAPGRLELQTDMTIEGKPGDPTAVIIDASKLPASSFQDGTLTTGALRMGRGHNALRWLTLRNAPLDAAGFVETDLPPTAPDDQTSVTVEHCVIYGNPRGIDFRLAGAAFNGRTLRGTFKDNLLFGNNTGPGQGLRVVHVQGVTGATLVASLEKNAFQGNLVGLLVASNNSSGNTLVVESSKDRHSGNAVGAILAAGIASGGGHADDNRLTFFSHDDVFDGNDQTSSTYTDSGSGLAVLGADTLTAPAAGRANRNFTSVELRDPRFSDNSVRDVAAFGARGGTALVAGTQNVAVIVIDGHTRHLDIDPTQSVPAEPTNHLTIVQHPECD
jgi:hypothetical protein